MSAAPADFRPLSYVDQKIKKRADGSAPTIELAVNPDISAEIGAAKKPGQILVAFAAETQNAMANGRDKLRRKNADFIVINEVGVDKVFGEDANEVTIVPVDGEPIVLGRRSKDDVADVIWDQLAR